MSNPRLLPARVLGALTGAALSVLACAAAAQAPHGGPSAPHGPAPGPSAPETPTTTKPAAPPARLDPVEITGSGSDNEQRRASTATKIIIGRDEIERFGDSSVADVLRRLPGITTDGRPGRGGAPRMRGLGGGYTQILVNGERMPPGFSLDTLPPEQVERIEILRAPTAEFGARAIAGTINIVLREALQKRLNELRLTAGLERGRLQPHVAWVRNDSLPAGGAYNFTLSAARSNGEDEIDTRTTSTDLASGATVLDQRESGTEVNTRESLHVNSRVQWRLGAGDQLILQPFAVVSNSRGHAQRNLVQAVGSMPVPYTQAQTDSDSRFRLLRLHTQLNRRLGEETRLELRANYGQARFRNDTFRTETDDAGALTRTLADDTRNRDRNGLLAGKLSHQTGKEHSLVSGFEVASNQRDQMRRTLQDGQPLFTELGENFDVSTLRIAAYAQDEWNPTSRWSAYAGLRWEGITTRSEDVGDVRNRSSVWTPLAHAVWKPQERSRDQLRFSLTRSYKSPTLAELIARPALSTRFPVPGANIASNPDRAGNPQLKPELASGIDIAYENYLSKGGLLSINLFYRRISDLIRNVTTLEDVSWAPVPRYVSRPQNIGDATTQGIELEAKMRLDELVADALPISLRGNVSLFRSKVEAVPGPDNRLDQQPRATANLGADYRLRSAPLSLGGNVNWTAGGRVQQTVAQSSSADAKLVADAFVLWTIDRDAQLRLSASNVLAHDYMTSSTIVAAGERQTVANAGTTHISWSLRLELRL